MSNLIINKKMKKNNEQEVKDIFVNLEQDLMKDFFLKGAIQINFEKPFTLSSGAESPLNVEPNKMFHNFDTRGNMCHLAYFALISNTQMNNFDLLVTSGDGGSLWGTALANNHCKSMVRVRQNALPYGSKQKLDGDVEDGAKVLIIDSMITTGNTVLDAIETVQRESGKRIDVLGVMSIVDWDLPETNKKFEKKGISKMSLMKVPDLIRFGKENKLISEKGYKKLTQWLKILRKEVSVK